MTECANCQRLLDDLDNAVQTIRRLLGIPDA